MDMEPDVDGIFRAVPNSVGSQESSGVAPGLGDRYVVTLNLAGELYQALFDSQVCVFWHLGVLGVWAWDCGTDARSC